MNGASVAIAISDIPWNGPIAGVILGYVDGEYVLNPTLEQKAKSQMMVTIAATEAAKSAAKGSAAQDKAFQEYLKLTKNNHSALKRLIHRQGISFCNRRS